MSIQGGEEPTPVPGIVANNLPSPTPEPLLVGHVTWQGPPAQPSAGQQQPVSLTLKLVSVVALMIYFSIVSLGSAFAIGILSSGASLSSFQQGVSGSVMPHDLALFFAKGLGLGTIVGWLSCHFGLEVKSSPTEVPQQASRAVVMSLLGCVVYNTALTAGFYWLVGPPLPAP